MMISAPVSARGLVLVSGVTLRHRLITRGGSAISRQRRQIAALRGRVALMRALKACHSGLLALDRRAPTDLTAGLVLSRIDAVREVAIAGGLITIGSSLVAVRARLVSLTARLITICERLLAVGERLLTDSERLLVTEPPRSPGVAVMLSLDRPVGGLLETII
jgi:hypothetical protein